MTMHINDFDSNVHKLLIRKRQFKTNENLCLWCDLLGFGNQFFEKQWKLTRSEKEAVYERLSNAHLKFLNNTSPLTETSLILNDGLVKVSVVDYEVHPDVIGFFLRGCVTTHLEVNAKERETGLPGARSILTFGDSIEYFHPEVKVDDYVLNYTKKDPDALSTIAVQTGNPTVVFNPIPFQMNMGFSKAYILDSLGSKVGISGNGFFIDHSVIDFSIRLAGKKGIRIVREHNGKNTRFCLSKGNNSVYWGFEWSEEISVEHKGWMTTVYRLVSFYPPDERMDEFCYCLEKAKSDTK